jgi:hypothetical protein
MKFPEMTSSKRCRWQFFVFGEWWMPKATPYQTQLDA